MKLRLFICLLFFIACVLGCNRNSSTRTSHIPSEVANSSGSIGRNSKLSYKITEAAERTFGYNIYLGGKILIQQQNVPCLAGSRGFLTKRDAEKVARLVMSKLYEGKLPPTITLEEMENLNVIK